MIYYIAFNTITMSILLIWLYIERKGKLSYKSRLEKSTKSCVKLQEVISQKNENEENLRIQMSRWQEIAREEQRRHEEIQKMTVKDHIENLGKY